MGRRLPLLLAGLAVMGACSSTTTIGTGTTSLPASSTTAHDGSPPATGPSTTPATTPATTTAKPPVTTAPAIRDFHWEKVPSTLGTGTVQRGYLDVPIDYADPSKGTLRLFIARHLADPKQRLGSLLVNPGGPGFGGSEFALGAEQIYSTTLTEHFDIIGWDPRGTGLSSPAIDCITDYDHFYANGDITPDTPAEHQQLVDLAKEFADNCERKNADTIQYVGTNNSARDMNAIREALGEAKISYFGFSYGSELGAVWATLFPNTVRAAVLDGAIDPTAGLTESNLQQTVGFEHSIDTFLAQCSAKPECVFHHGGDAAGAFDRLMLQLDDHPVPSVPGRPDVSRGVALTAVGQAMYSQSLWPTLEQALADAEAGNGAGLLQLYDDYYRRKPDGTYDNLLEAFQVIECQDRPERPTVAEDDATSAQFRAAAPRFAPGTTGSYFCTFFAPAQDPRVAITGKGAGPILVMGTTGDPATPLAGTEKMATTLEQGRLVVVTADQHTGYGVNQCSYDVVDLYLVDPVHHVPKNNTRCD